MVAYFPPLFHLFRITRAREIKPIERFIEGKKQTHTRVSAHVSLRISCKEKRTLLSNTYQISVSLSPLEDSRGGGEARHNGDPRKKEERERRVRAAATLPFSPNV